MLKLLITISSKDRKINAKGLYDIDTGKVMILEGSNIREIRIDNYRYFDVRNELINSGKIKNSIFQDDIEFDDPNIAAGIILGRNALGKERFKLENGKPLSSIGEKFGCGLSSRLSPFFRDLLLDKEKPANLNELKVKAMNYRKHWKYDSKRFCEESYNYLLSIKPDTVTDKDLEFSWKGSFNKYDSLNAVLERMLISTQNYQSRPNIIKYRLDGGRKEKIDKLLFGLDAQKILENYNAVSLCELFQKELGINPGMVRKSWCKSIISSCEFLCRFKAVNEFKDFIESYNKDVDSRAKLIKYIQHNIHGFGFALSCDFIKEMGYTSFCKPDVHIKDVLLGLGLCNSTDDEIVFRCLNNLAEEGGFTPYKLDKILWIICSGKFYSGKVNIKAEIPRHKDDFISYMQNL